MAMNNGVMTMRPLDKGPGKTVKLAPGGYHLMMFDLNPPAAWTEFRVRIKAADAVLFVTSEHNGSVSAALKNA
jgi:copper(I)-binding protein